MAAEPAVEAAGSRRGRAAITATADGVH